MELAPHKGLCLLVNQNNARAQNFYLKLGAVNARVGSWAAPDGSAVPTFWFCMAQVRGVVGGHRLGFATSEPGLVSAPLRA